MSHLKKEVIMKAYISGNFTSPAGCTAIMTEQDIHDTVFGKSWRNTSKISWGMGIRSHRKGRYDTIRCDPIRKIRVGGLNSDVPAYVPTTSREGLMQHQWFS
jgi:hypothetical protein